MTRVPGFVSIAVVATLLAAPAAAASPNPIAHRSAALAAGDRLLEVQFDSGALPWVVGTSGEYQNVQGVSAQGLVAAYQVSLNQAYLDDGTGGGAKATRDWLANYFANPANTWASAGTVFFLADYAVATLDPADLALARQLLAQTIAQVPVRNAGYPGTPAGLVEYIIATRAAQGHTNLGLWDAALYIRSAQNAGLATEADEMAAAPMGQDIVDAFNAGANWYELGLTGLLFGLAESDVIGHFGAIKQAKKALVATQCDDGSFPVTYGGGTTCGDAQGTAYAAIGLSAVGATLPATDACDQLVATQTPEGGWLSDGDEYAEVDAEAAMALTACTLLVPGGLIDYTDQLRGLL